MAELLRQSVKNLGIEAEIESAGTTDRHKGSAAKEATLACMRRNDMDISHHRARFVGDLNLGDYDLLVAADPAVEASLRTLAPGANIIVANPQENGIADPSGKGDAAYDEMFTAVERSLLDIITKVP